MLWPMTGLITSYTGGMQRVGHTRNVHVMQKVALGGITAHCSSPQGLTPTSSTTCTYVHVLRQLILRKTELSSGVVALLLID